MINLLPSEVKQNFRFAKRNRLLLKWIVAFIVAIFGLAIITGAGIYSMNSSIHSYANKITADQTKLKSENITYYHRQVALISNNLNLMVKVLSKEILFSSLLTRLGTLTPANVALTNLTIAQNETAVDITAQAASYSSATQLQVNLSSPSNQIFQKADIVSITCQSGPLVKNSSYPCSVDIRAEFTKHNPFLFINSKGTLK